MKKRLLAYFLVWVLVAIPTLSYAWLPIAGGVARAVVATKAGQVLVKKGARWVKHQYQNGNLSEGLQWLLVMCGSYQDFTGESCTDVGRKAYNALTNDNWTIEQTDNGIEIYKVGCGYTGYPRDALYDTFELACNSFLSQKTKYFKTDSVVIEPNSLGEKTCFIKSTSTINGSKSKFAVGIKQICTDDRHRRYLTSDDIWNMIQDPGNGFDDQDITNILNYDYSDKSVTINNHTYNGGDIKYSFDPNININRDGDGTDGKPGWGLEIDPTFAPKLVPILINPKIKIGLPDINYNNCTANAEGTIVSCDKLEREYDIDIDGDGKKGNDDPTCQYGYTLKDGKCVKVDPKPPTTDNPKPPAEQKPWVCTTSEFTRKVCDLIDWTQKEHALNNDTQMTIDDLTDRLPPMDTNRIKFGSQCPPAETHTISLMGVSVNFKIKYDQYCDFMVKFKPFAIGLASISAVLIIAGRKHG